MLVVYYAYRYDISNLEISYWQDYFSVALVILVIVYQDLLFRAVQFSAHRISWPMVYMLIMDNGDNKDAKNLAVIICRMERVTE